MGFNEFVLNFTQSGGWPVISAFLIGLLAAISPCPLTTNITALAFISRNVTDRKYVAVAGALYTLGRMVSYFTVGAIIILAGVNVPGYHLHFLTRNRDAGGHVLELTVGEATAFVDDTPAFIMLLPGQDSDFYKLDLTRSQQDEVGKVEK